MRSIRILVLLILAATVAACGKAPDLVAADCIVQPALPMRDHYPAVHFADAITYKPNCASGDAACSKWQEFRNDHPYPVQTFAGSRIGGERALLVLSEPPPDLGHNDATTIAANVFQGLHPDVSTRRWQIGPDGYVEDVLVAFDAPALKSDDLLTSADIKDRIASLHLAWFGTSCGGDVEIINDGNARVMGAAPNLDINAKEVGDWLTDPAESWTSIEEPAAAAQTWSDLAGAHAQGAYLSHNSQLVLFTFDHSVLDDASQLAALRPAFRRFAVSTDAVVGAVWARGGTGQVAFLGRRRTHPLSQIEPLRFETFVTLVSTTSDELAQSYERTTAAAGRLQTENRDWAPIYLSQDLRDSEFGSLLNVTDQMLKGWSQHGETSYLTFAYPRTPAQYPFDRPLSSIVMERTKSQETLFNWNTTGAAAAVDRGDLTVLIVGKTGSLPIDYGADIAGHPGDPKFGMLQDQEKRAYQYFSGLGDPNLSRVVQYTMIYQALRNLRKDAGVSADRQLVSKLKPESQALATAVMKLWPTVLGGHGQFAAALPKFKAKYPSVPDPLIAVVMVDRNEGIQVVASQVADLPEDFVDDLAELTDFFQQDVGRLGINLAPLRNSFQAAANHDAPGWIRTQSHIISWNKPTFTFDIATGTVSEIVPIGGHNLNSAVDHFIESSAGGAPNEGQIAFASQDGDKYAAHAAEYARARQHDHADEKALQAILDKPILSRKAAEALGFGREPLKEPVARLGGRVMTSDQHFIDTLLDMKQRAPCCRLMARNGDGHAFVAEAHPVPPPVFRVRGFGDTASMGHYLRHFEGKPDDLIVLDQSQASVDALLIGLSDKAQDPSIINYVRNKFRSAVDRMSGRADHFITTDLAGERGNIVVDPGSLSDLERDQLMADLKNQSVRVAGIEDVPPQEMAKMVAGQAWHEFSGAPPVGIRIRLQSDKGGGFGILDVLTRFGRQPDSRTIRTAITVAISNNNNDQKLGATILSIRHALEKSGDLTHIRMVLKKGTTAIQMAGLTRQKASA